MTMGREGGKRRTLFLEIILSRGRVPPGELESISLAARAQILANDETQRLATRLLNMCQDMQPREGENATDQWSGEGGRGKRKQAGKRPKGL